MSKKHPPEDKNPQQNPPPYPGYPPSYVVYPQEEPIDWAEYWRAIVERKKLIVIITGASTPHGAQGQHGT